MFRQLNARLDLNKVLPRLQIPVDTKIPRQVTCPDCGNEAALIGHPIGGLTLRCPICGDRTLLEVFLFRYGLENGIKELAAIGGFPSFMLKSIAVYVKSYCDQVTLKELLKLRTRAIQSNEIIDIFTRFGITAQVNEGFMSCLNSTPMRIIERAQLFNSSRAPRKKLQSPSFLVIPYYSFYGDLSGLRLIPIYQKEDEFDITYQNESGIMWIGHPEIVFQSFSDMAVAMLDYYSIKCEPLQTGIVFGRPDHVWSCIPALKEAIIWGNSLQNSIELGAASDKFVVAGPPYQIYRKSNPMAITEKPETSPWWELILNNSGNQLLIRNLDIDDIQWQTVIQRASPSERAAILNLKENLGHESYNEIIVDCKRVRERTDGWYQVTEQGEELISEAILRINDIISSNDTILFRGTVTIAGRTLSFTAKEREFNRSQARFIRNLAVKNGLQYPVISTKWQNKLLQIAIRLRRPRQMNSSSVIRFENDKIITPTTEISKTIKCVCPDFIDLPFGFDTTEYDHRVSISTTAKTLIAIISWMAMASTRTDSEPISLVAVGSRKTNVCEALEQIIEVLNLDNTLSPFTVWSEDASRLYRKVLREEIPPWSLIYGSPLSAIALSQRLNAIYVEDCSQALPLPASEIRRFALYCLYKMANYTDYIWDFEKYITGAFIHSPVTLSLKTPLNIPSIGLNFLAYIYALDCEHKIHIFGKRPLIEISNDEVELQSRKIMELLAAKYLPYPSSRDVVRSISEEGGLLDTDTDHVVTRLRYFESAIAIYDRYRSRIYDKYGNEDPSGRIILQSPRFVRPIVDQ